VGNRLASSSGPVLSSVLMVLCFVVYAALWLGIATISAFGLVEVQYISSSNANLIYLTTLVMVTVSLLHKAVDQLRVCLAYGFASSPRKVHLVVSPWLLRTIHRKGSQADEFFGYDSHSASPPLFAHHVVPAERSPRKRNTEDDSADGSNSDEDSMDARAAAVQPVNASPRGASRTASQRKPRRQGCAAKRDKNNIGFFNAEGNATMSQLQLAMEGVGEGVPAPRSARRQSGTRPASPRISAAAAHAVVEMSPPVEPQHLHQIPFASPVFLMDPEANLPAPDFWQLWKQTETT